MNSLQDTNGTKRWQNLNLMSKKEREAFIKDASNEFFKFSSTKYPKNIVDSMEHIEL